MPSIVITKLHSRAAALFAVGALLLFIAIPVLHIVTAAPDHHAEHCPICQTLQHAGNILSPEAPILAAVDMPPEAAVLRAEVSLPSGAPLAIHPTRAPPAV